MANSRGGNTIAFYGELNRLYFNDWSDHDHQVTSSMAISIGRDDSGPRDWLGRGAAHAFRVPSKLLPSPLLDAFGSAGWRQMSRRTQTLVEGPSDFEARAATDEEIREYVRHGT